MWNKVNHRRFPYCESSQRYYNYNNYEQMRSKSDFVRGYYNPYYSYLHWRRNYQPYSYADAHCRRSYRQSTISLSYNFKSSTNERYVKKTYKKNWSHVSKNPVYLKTSESVISKDIDVNSKTSKSSQNLAASKYLCPTDFTISSVSLKTDRKESVNHRKESVNLHAKKGGATIVTKSKIHTFNVGMNGSVGSHFSEPQPEIKFVPSGCVISSSQHDIKKNAGVECSSIKDKSAEECNRLTQSRSDKDSSSSNLCSHCKASNNNSADNSLPASRVLNLCDKKHELTSSSNSDASDVHYINMSRVSDNVKSECPDEQSFLKTEGFLDCDYSNLVSVSTFDAFVKREAPDDLEDSIIDYFESKLGILESKPGDSFLLSTSIMEKRLSDYVHLQPVSLSETGLSIIETACMSQENFGKAATIKREYKSFDQDHRESSVSASPATTFENISEKHNVKSEIKHMNFIEASNKGSEPKYESERENIKYLTTICEESGKVKREYDNQLITDTFTKGDREDEKCDMLSSMLTSSRDTKPNVKTGNENQHDFRKFRQSRSCAVMDRVRDECPLGHFLKPVDATFNIQTGRITVPCRSCNILVYMKSNIDFV